MTPVLRRLAPAPAADRQLLSAFTRGRDEAAFAELVRRHGPLVFGVCRRVLGHAQDAEDAFQATFLVLARKAASVTRTDTLAPWLHAVAVRTARELRHMRERRRHHELASGGRQPAVEPTEPDDLAALLDAELAALPARLRAAVVLCELEGRPRKAAAALLGIPEGTLSSRLAAARKALAARLARRGVTAPAAAAALAAATADRVPAALLGDTARAAADLAAGAAPAAAAAVAAADGVVKALFVSKLKGVAVALAVAAVAAGGWAVAPAGGPPDPSAEALVKQLGAPAYRDREDAEAKLLAKPAAAFPAVKAGLADPDPEVAARCKALIPRLYSAALSVPDHPAWVRFKKITGGGDAARALFLEAVADGRRAELLDAAESDPDRAGAVYAGELARRVGAMRQAFEEDRAANQFRTGLMAPTRAGPTRGEFTALLFLGTYPAAKEGDATERMYLHNLLGGGLARAAGRGTPAGPAETHRLFAAWVANRTDPATLRLGLQLAVDNDAAAVLPAARKFAADEKLAAAVRGQALLAVGHFGTAADATAAAKSFGDDRSFHATNYTDQAGKKSTVETQVRDAALAAALHLHKQKLADFGFTFVAEYKSDGPDVLKKYYLLGFSDDKQRANAHAKAKAWLDAAPAIDKQVRLLGSPAFADREAAGKAIKALGPVALPAVRKAMTDPDPEVARRAAALEPVLRAVSLAELRAALKTDPAAGADHPIRVHFRAVAGDDAAARRLLARLLANDAWAKAMDAAAADPAKAPAAYAEILRDHGRRFQFNMKVSFHIPEEGWPGNDPDEVALLLLLGGYPDTDPPAADKDARLGQERITYANGLSKGAAGPDGAAVRRLMTRWMAPRTGAAKSGAVWAAYYAGVPDGLQYARSYALDKDAPPMVRADALMYVGRFGSTAYDAHWLDRLRSDETECTTTTVKGKKATVQLRDVALSARLRQAGSSPEAFGQVPTREGPVEEKFAWQPTYQGYFSPEDRAAAHAKASAWLAEKK